MGTIRTNITVRNPVDRHRSIGLAAITLDDCDAMTLSWIPADALEAMGVQRRKLQEFSLSNGKRVRRFIGYALIEAGEFKTIDEVVFAEQGDDLKVGRRTLSGFNARIDRSNQRLVAAGPIPAAGNVHSLATNN